MKWGETDDSLLSVWYFNTGKSSSHSTSNMQQISYMAILQAIYNLLCVAKAKTSSIPDNIIQVLLDNVYSVASIEVPFI